MTIYAGEYVTLVAKAEGQKIPNKYVVLTEEDVDSVTVSIWHARGRQVVEDKEMDFDEETGLWRVYWDTAGLSPGEYQYRCTFFGEGNRRSWEEGTVTLHPSKRPVTVVVTD